MVSCSLSAPHWFVSRLAFGWACLCLVISVARAQPVVSEVTALQRVGTQMVDVTYNLVSPGAAAVEITVKVSKDGGATFEMVPASSLVAGGAFGTDQQAGVGKTFVWDASKQGWENALYPAVQVEVTASFTTRFVRIPEGAFLMGGTVGDGYRWEFPVHIVTVSTFHLQTKETSKAQWDRVRTWGLNHGYTDLYAGFGKAANHPVHRVSWYDVVKWCNAASEQAGLTPCYTVNGTVFRTGEDDPVLNLRAAGYRLPTEAEWEKAARGGLEGMLFPWGNTITHEQANYNSADMSGTPAAEIDISPTRGHHPRYATGNLPYTSPTGSFKANNYGLYDMAGNVYEWTGDWCGPTSSDYYSTDLQIDPTGRTDPYPGIIKRKYCRGGSWKHGYSASRTSYRYDSSNVWQRTDQLGFRPASTSVSLAPAEGHLSRSNRLALDLRPVDLDIEADALIWNAEVGGLDFEFAAKGAPLAVASAAELFWASGPAVTDVLAPAVFSHPIPIGFTGSGGKIHIEGKFLRNAPAATTHLLLVLDKGKKLKEENIANNFAALQDTKYIVAAGVEGVISPLTSGVIKDALRYAGEAEATITSFVRTDADQARVMFEVLKAPLTKKIVDKLTQRNLVPTSVNYSYNLYGANGDRVVDAYVAAAGKSDDEIKAAMTAEIGKIKKSNASAFGGHMSDPNVLQVIDIRPSSITNLRLFDKAISPATDARIIKHLSPFTPNVDQAFHIEVLQVASKLTNHMSYKSGRGQIDETAPKINSATLPLKSTTRFSDTQTVTTAFAAASGFPPLEATTELTLEDGAAFASGSVAKDHRVFTLSGAVGDRLTAGLAVTGIHVGTEYADDDSVLWLFDPEGRLVASNDDTDPLTSEFNSLIEGYILTRNGTYYVVVTTYGNEPNFADDNTISNWEDDGESAIDFDLYLRLSSKRPQQIALTNPGEKIFGAAPFSITVTSSSGLVPRLRVLSGPATLDGKRLILTGVGTVILYANEDGNAIYEAAEPVQQAFEVNAPKQEQRITFGQPGPSTFGSDSFTPTANASSGLTVRFEIVSSLPEGIASLQEDGRMLRIVGAGKVTLRAVQPGNAIYKPAAPVIRTLIIDKQRLLVSGIPASRLVGTANPALALSYTGFVSGDDFSDLAAATLPKPATKASKTSPAGRYPITFTGGLDKNYTFSAGPVENLTVLGFGGTYEALLFDGDTTPVGKLSLTVPANALTYTGTLTLAREARAVPIKYLLTAPLVATSDASYASATWTRNDVGSDTISLAFTVSAGGSLSGRLERNGEPFADFTRGARVVVFAKGQTAPGGGANTLALHPAYVLFDEDQGPIPGGSGHATATISASTGILTVKGFVSDGYPLTGAFKPTLQNTPGTTYLLWTNPYGLRTESFVSGHLSLQSHPEQSRFPGRYYVPSESGRFIWQKAALPSVPAPKTPDKSYRAGFGPLGIQVALDPWLPPATMATPTVPAGSLVQRLGLGHSSTATGEFILSHDTDELDLGARETLLPVEATLSSFGVFTAANAAATAWKIKLTPTTGAFTGSFILSDTIPAPTATNPFAAKIVLRTATFSGTLHQSPVDETAIGTGYYLLPGFVKTDEHLSGEIRFTAP